MGIQDRITDLRRVRAGDLIPSPRNWRRHPDAQRQALATMLERIGYVDAVLVRDTPDGLMLIDGHLRADLDPDAMLPALVLDLDEDEANQVLASLDPLAAMAEADTAMLAGLLEVVPEIPIDMTALYGLETLHAPPPGEADAEVAVPADPVTRPGQVWTLGRHRLMCGDSSNPDHVARLLDGAAPRLMVTDPPYGVDYDASWREGLPQGQLAGTPTVGLGRVENDHTGNWAATLDAARHVEVAYVWGPSLVVEFVHVLVDGGFNLRAQIIWRKPNFVVSRGHYHWQHELLWYAVRHGRRSGWTGDRRQSTIWDIAGLQPTGRSRDEADADKSGHSTQKPVECMERPIRNHAGDVYDPFVGSGTTIIAAERQGRTCYAMEIVPAYVDAAVRRWELYTGQSAVLDTMDLDNA